MFIDAREIPDGKSIEADLCVIGAGAAGITIAREMIGTQLRVIVLESGGFEFDERTQSLYEGLNIGFPDDSLHLNRLRFLGGTTNHWTGHCRPLDPIDFERRDWVPHSGWPISRTQLRTYYERAQPILGLPPYHYGDLDFLVEQSGARPLELDPRRLKTVVYNQSPPIYFGLDYKDELRRASNVAVYLHANALELESNETASTVTAVQVACIDGPRFAVRAKRLVLAMGGLEIPRLLLLSNKVAPAGLGNSQDLVGRFFLNHVLVKPVVTIVLSAKDVTLPLYHDLHEVAGGLMFAILAPPDQLMREEKLRNFRMHIYKKALLTPGQESFKVIGKALRGGSLPGHLGRHIANMVSDIDDVTKFAYQRLFNTNADLGEQDAIVGLELQLVSENTPDPDSQVTLAEDRDLFGQNRILVNWRVSDEDLRTVSRAGELAVLEFGRLGLGRGRVTFLWDGGDGAGHLQFGTHHSGTTRMSDDPKTGVVDVNCQLHGIGNLYVASSAVFPTNGYANPTLTIVALSLRLADHLKQLA